MPYFGWCQDSGNPPAAHKNIKTVCGGNVQTHSLRRAFCSRMVATGFNALAICRMTGHSSPDELSEYVTLDPEQLRQIVEAEHNQKFYDKNEIVFRPTPSA
jgi:site-specific recombinase XerD